MEEKRIKSLDLRGRLRGASNLLQILVRLIACRVYCVFFGHVSAFDAEKSTPTFRYFSVVHKGTRNVQACRRCGGIYSTPMPGEEDPSSGVRWRDLL